ncbi:hypothetical protein KJ693_12665 [bacterium]|nr:hypothetical protein [bacterium]MBU1616144.1 hypothetical protein [bacterium]
MSNEKAIFFWEGLKWDVNYDINGEPEPFALCPKCHCRLTKSKEKYSIGEYKYRCINCDFKITLDKSIEDKGKDFLCVKDSLQYKDAEIINIDGELIKVQRKEQKDEDYWIDVKMSRNKKGELQLMVLAGSRKSKDKTQLFLDPKNERLAFDQNNDHPSKIFTKVVGIFKNSKSEIHSKDTELGK